MQTKVFSIFDSKVGAFLPPFFMRTIGEAERMISNYVGDPKHDFFKFSEDYTLFDLGNFDDSKGSFDLHSTPVSISLFSVYKSKVEDSNSTLPFGHTSKQKSSD